MTEVWKTAPVLNHQYEVSSMGRIRHRVKMTLVSQRIMRGGYLQTCLYNPETRQGKSFMVHRLVALTFLGAPNGLQVNHIDCSKTNNRVENLEYVTATENMRHAKEHGLRPSRRGTKAGGAVLTEKQVLRIAELIRAGRPYAEIARTFGVSSGAIRSIAIGNNWPWLTGIKRDEYRRRGYCTDKELAEIIWLKYGGASNREIGRKIGRSHSFVARQLRAIGDIRYRVDTTYTPVEGKP